MMGYRTEFSFDIANNNFVVESDGELITYETVKQGNAILEVINDSTDTVREYPIYPIQVKDAKKLNGIQASTTSVALTTNTLPGYEEEFSQAEIEILLKDQYGNEWTGDYDLELSSTVDDVDEALGGTTSSPAYLDGTTLYIDAENIMDVTNRTSLLPLEKATVGALFRQQIYNASVGERSDLMKGSLREGAGAGRD